MRVSSFVPVGLTVLLMSVFHIGAASLEKAYFSATPPGAWATYESSWEMPNGMGGTNAYTFLRASDSEDRIRFEVTTEVLTGPGEGGTTRQLFIMEPAFDFGRNFMNYMGFVEASVSQSGDGPATLMQANIIDILRGSASDLTNSVTFTGTKTVAGHECDHYTFSYSSGGPHITHHEGEICLNEAVPFGVVSQKGRSTDQEGTPGSSYGKTLVDSGIGRSATEALLVMTPTSLSEASAAEGPEADAGLPLADAFQGGKVRLVVSVLEGTGGRRLKITTVNQVDERLELIVPKGPFTVHAGFPIGDLNLVVDREHLFSLEPGASSPAFSAGQSGDRGAVGGNFQLTVSEGKTLYQGSVDVGPLE